MKDNKFNFLKLNEENNEALFIVSLEQQLRLTKQLLEIQERQLELVKKNYITPKREDIENAAWHFKCPCCGVEIDSKYSLKKIKEYLGATTNCPKCDSLLMILKDYTCEEFAKFSWQCSYLAKNCINSKNKEEYIIVKN